jgi:hypothetical protein
MTASPVGDLPMLASPLTAAPVGDRPCETR